MMESNRSGHPQSGLKKHPSAGQSQKLKTSMVSFWNIIGASRIISLTAIRGFPKRRASKVALPAGNVPRAKAAGALTAKYPEFSVFHNTTASISPS